MKKYILQIFSKKGFTNLFSIAAVIFTVIILILAILFAFWKLYLFLVSYFFPYAPYNILHLSFPMFILCWFVLVFFSNPFKSK